jgi:hypothetical protein
MMFDARKHHLQTHPKYIIFNQQCVLLGGIGWEKTPALAKRRNSSENPWLSVS